MLKLLLEIKRWGQENGLKPWFFYIKTGIPNEMFCIPGS